MQCSNHHHHHESGHESHEPPRTEQECLEEAAEHTQRSPHCPAEWDQVVEMCWPPAMPRTKAVVGCPDKPGLNPLHYACRDCLSNGTWLVSYDQDPKQAFTNFHDCFVFEKKEFKLKMEALLGRDKLEIYETMTHPGETYYWLHGISMLMIAASLLLWISHWVYHGSKNGKYKFMSMSCVALFSVHLVNVIYRGEDCFHHLAMCYLFRILSTLFELLFYSGVLINTFYSTVYVSHVSLPKIVRRVCAVTWVSAMIIALVLEWWIEVVRPPHSVCVFGLYINPYHWLILGFKLSLNGGTFSLICVTLYGLFWLKFTSNCCVKRVKIMRQNMTLLLVWIVYSFLCQLAPVFVDHMHNMSYSLGAIVDGTHVYTKMVACSGLLFTILTCFLDIEMLAYISTDVRKYLKRGNHQMPILTVTAQLKRPGEFL